MSGLTKIEMEFCERVPHELGRIADSLKKIADSKEQKTEDFTGVQTKEEHPKDSPFEVLAVTKVDVFPFTSRVNMGRMKGLASVVLNDQLAIRSLRVMEGENGLFVGYPPDNFYKGEDYRSQCFPMTRQLREHIENCVLEKYQELTK